MGWFQKLIYGVDLEAEQKRSDALDAAIARENATDYGPGGSVYNEIAARDGAEAANRTYEEVQARQAASAIDVEAEVGQAFQEGLDEGAANIRGIVAAPLDLAFQLPKVIPWQVWFIGAVMLFFYMGGGPWLARKLKGLFA